ncbi:2-dehydro-3-deoxygalactonokinase [[Enterobacter] lignolyticus]|uniref:2-dehydro-3-deoxygalactonokinase n=1 Tax=[Enterobacter] lignolyticus TaxID=1334193 RepID=UPI0009007237|nr:2-dehydro-3-deoxygalactonokinase [[Enterobacter] lignolyticus]
MLIVTIDSGTTNTRVRVWRGKTAIADASEPVGVRDTAITGSRAVLIDGVKKALDRALAQLQDGDAGHYMLVASGMITANVGLHPVPHLRAPVSLDDLVRGAVAHTIPEIDARPVWFIPGVKNAVVEPDADHIDAVDVMRGEEVETFGLLRQHNLRGPALVVLPGSHSKFVLVDDRQRIISSATTMAGELLDVLTHHTILTTSLDGQFAAALDVDYLLKGAESCRRVGLARSCFGVRLLDLFTTASHDQKASYLLGATFSSDLQAMKHSLALNLAPETPIVVSGKPILRQALTALIGADPFFRGSITQVNEDPTSPLSGIGAIAVMEKILQRQQDHRVSHDCSTHQGIPT